MTAHAGIIRQTASLHHTLEQLQTCKANVTAMPALQPPTKLWIEYRNLLDCALLTLTDCLEQTKNAGLHFNIDLAQPSDNTVQDKTQSA